MKAKTKAKLHEWLVLYVEHKELERRMAKLKPEIIEALENCPDQKWECDEATMKLTRSSREWLDMKKGKELLLPQTWNALLKYTEFDQVRVTFRAAEMETA